MTLHAPERLAIARPDAYLAAFRIQYSQMVHIGDRFSLLWRESGSASVGDGLEELSTLDTDFEVLNQHGQVTCAGGLRVCLGRGGEAPVRLPPPAPLPIEPWSAAGLTMPLSEKEMLSLGPRGASLGRTLTEADVVGFANFTGELNPLYLNDEFARSGPFGARIVPPMLIFCLGFGDYLRDLLALPMPSDGFAGHLGDSWRFFSPVHVGDTIRVRHKPVACDRSNSRPGMAIVQFALQIENQRNEIVQDGRIAMMMPLRDAA
jgi:acyl dehydratase